MSNTIEIELCAEDRSRLDAIIAGLEKLSGMRDCRQCLDSTGKVIQDVIHSAEPKPKPEPEPKPEPKPEPEPEKVVDMNEVQKRVTAVAQAGKRQQVIDLVHEYAERVSLIPSDKMNEFYERVCAMEVQV